MAPWALWLIYKGLDIKKIFRFILQENKGGFATLEKNHNAGLCFPLLEPFGCLEQELPVKLEILDRLVPQYLHSYLAFSLPSYSVCLPLFDPNGCLEQELPVKLEMLERFVPQCSQ